MKMSDQHMAAFREAALANFEDRMWTHVSEFFPEQCQVLGEPKSRALIRDGITKAAGYGFTTERDVCKYIDLTFAFGRDFDQTPWAAIVLNHSGSACREPQTRIACLYVSTLSTF